MKIFILATRYNIPFLINRPDTGNFIKGEVYSVDEQMMARLDVLEDYPEFYDREIQDINVGTDEKEKCWIYIIKTFPEKLLSLPLLSEYKNTPDRAYQERCQRVSNILAKDDLEYDWTDVLSFQLWRLLHNRRIYERLKSCFDDSIDRQIKESLLLINPL